MSLSIQDDPFWHQPMRRLPPADEDAISIHEVSFGAKSLWREIAETIILTLLIFLALRMVVQNFMVEGPSMEPTLHSQQYLLVNKLAYAQWDINFLPRMLSGNDQPPPNVQYLMEGPRRGDIVVFIAPDDNRDFIKRVIALPGETVQVKANEGVFVNNSLLPEPYVDSPPQYNYGPETIPEDHLFVLGDNRNNSRDSHAFGPIVTSTVVGTAWFSYWPQSTWGFLRRAEYP